MRDFFNIKWSLFSAIPAFALSLLLGLISGAGLLALLRSGIFALLFFVMGSLFHGIISRFLPELLEGSGNQGPTTFSLDPGMGTNVDISVEGEENPYGGEGSSNEDSGLGFNDPPMDHNEEAGYTNSGSTGAAPADEAGPVTLPGGDSVDTLPEIAEAGGGFTGGALAGGAGFTPTLGDSTLDVSAGEDSSPYGGGASMVGQGTQHAELEGDWQANDIAKAIQTVLKRDTQ